MKKFHWLPTECAPVEYPMQFVTGTLSLRDESFALIPRKSLRNNGWGIEGSTHVVGPDVKPVPVRLELSWFSYTEDKFFKGKADLPAERIEELLQERIQVPIVGGPQKGGIKDEPAYNRVLVGIAPKGFVAVWASGTYRTTEITSFSASEAQLDWKEITDNTETTRKRYIEEVLADALSSQQLERLRKNGVPTGLWEARHTRFNSSLNVQGGAQINELGLWMVNGERERYFLPKEHVFPVKQRAVLQMLRIRWKGVSSRKVGAEILLDPEEVSNAFHRLHKENSDVPLSLQIELLGADDSVRLSLANGKSVFYFKRSVTKEILPE